MLKGLEDLLNSPDYRAKLCFDESIVQGNIVVPKKEDFWDKVAKFLEYTTFKNIKKRLFGG
jgi:hypothetical protein